MQRWLLSFLLLCLILGALPVGAAEVAVECTRMTREGAITRLVLQTDGPVAHQIFRLTQPERVVLDMAHARLVSKLPQPGLDDPTLIGFRSGVRNADDLRIVIDLKRAIRVKSFLDGVSANGGHRLVVDLIPEDQPAERIAERPAGQAVPVRTPAATTGQAPQPRHALIAIDAGHGGKDPGAIGPAGTLEKDVTLAIARKLERLIEREPGMRALMIRDGDYYIGLRQRMELAREHGADLFISIHADAYNNPDAHGSSVYTLSQGGASSEAAEWLADRENSADLIGGVDLSASDEMLATVLLDMAQNATIEHSGEAADAVLDHLKQVGEVHKGDVQRAGFVVLKSPDIPSMLVEMAFISNESEEQRLRSNAHQQRLAQAILAGVRSYFNHYPPHGLLSTAVMDGDAEVPLRRASSRPEDVAELPLRQASSRLEPSAESPPRHAAGSVPVPTTRARQYVISPGDTLSGIATRHQVSLRALMEANHLADSATIYAGQVLAIPDES